MKYWIGVVCKDHVMRGVQGGFAQVCHGKEGPLKRMSEGDWIIYYSPVIGFGEKKAFQSFTAIGQILQGDPYPFAMSDDFIPYRRNVQFYAANEAPISPLIEKLTFIKDKKKWGFPFRRGCFSVSKEDFRVIATQMGVTQSSIFEI